MARRPCLVCGTPSIGSRCGWHGSRRVSSTARGLDRRHRTITRMVIEAWVARHGWVCPGFDRSPHPVPDGALTGDHILPRSTHPHLMHDINNYQVLCDPCNKHKSNKLIT